MSDGATKYESATAILSKNPGDPLQMGFWAPNRIWATAKFLIPLRKMLDAKREAGTLTPMTPEMMVFKHWVTTHSVYRMWVNAMIDQANAYVASQALLGPEVLKEIKEDGDILWISGYDEFFELLNEFVTTSPSFNDTAMVGTPMNGLLAVAMATEAGLALFHDAIFNEHFKKVLDACPCDDLPEGQGEARGLGGQRGQQTRSSAPHTYGQHHRHNPGLRPLKNSVARPEARGAPPARREEWRMLRIAMGRQRGNGCFTHSPWQMLHHHASLRATRA
jgi:hypothetical protein